MTTLKAKYIIDENGDRVAPITYIDAVRDSNGDSLGTILESKADSTDVSDLQDLIPVQATASNQLADKDFVNSSVSTATATYRGCYNLVSDLSLTTQASHGQIETALATAVSGTPDNNDYAFVQIPTDDTTPTEIASVERYKFNGTLWSFEYTLNNSGFTAAQWAAVNSNITSGLVTKLNALSTNSQNSITSLFGMDANGNFENISTANLASVLGGVSAWVDVNDMSFSRMLTGGSTVILPIVGRYNIVFYQNLTSGSYNHFGLISTHVDDVAHRLEPNAVQLAFQMVSGGLKVRNLTSETLTFVFRVFHLYN